MFMMTIIGNIREELMKLREAGIKVISVVEDSETSATVYYY